MTKQAHRSSAAIDGLRAAMLRGKPLRDLADPDREWVMRSLLKGVRRKQAVQLAGLDAVQVDRALVRVKQWYDDRIDTYKRQQASERQHPKVVRAVAPAAAPRRGFFGLFGKGR